MLPVGAGGCSKVASDKGCLLGRGGRHAEDIRESPEGQREVKRSRKHLKCGLGAELKGRKWHRETKFCGTEG